MTAPILYVEDEEDYQILVKHILKRAGLEVLIAETGAEGLQALMREHPSLLVLDINLPDTNGYSLCGQLRQDSAWRDLPILMLTVRRRPDEWLLGFSSGANDYLSKPLNPPELIERVVNCLQGKTHPFNREGTAEYNLIQAAVGGNRSAFEVLIQKYRERLMESLRNSVRNDAHLDDVIAHTFATAFGSLAEFRGESSFYTWIYRIALNQSISVYRKPRTAVSLDYLANGEESFLFAKAVPQEGFDTTLAEREINRQALEALDRVPELYREILEMHFLQDLSYESISKQLRIPEGTVMSRLHKARKLLQEAWLRRPELAKPGV